MDSWMMDAETLGIGKLLMDGNRFSVPLRQREYSWTADEIDQLFVDIEAARAAGRPEYFLGLVVFVAKSPTEFTILDGQQRIATAVIILASIRDWLRAHGHHKYADKIQEEFIGHAEYGIEDQVPRLALNENNNQLFEEFVVNERPSDEVRAKLNTLGKYDVSRLLLEAVLFCRERVAQIAGDAAEDHHNQSAPELYQLIIYLRDAVKVVRVAVHSEAEAYVVFETLNYRGVQLNVLDLVKNHLFGTAAAPERQRDAQKRWTQMMGNLTDLQPATFLKVYWTSRYGRVQTNEIYDQFKARVNDWQDATETLDDMRQASDLYAALTVADSQVWDEVAASRPRVRALKVLGARQAHPVLLSAIERFTPKQLGRLLRLLEVLIVRYQLIGHGRTGLLEIACASLASQIYQGQTSNASQALAELKGIYPSDEEFKAAFSETGQTNSAKAKYLLKTLESQAQLKTGKPAEWDPKATLTLEHILPRNPGSQWKGELQADKALAEDCTHQLGNLCLLTDVNRALGTKSFARKKESFAESTMLLTKQVADYQTWDRQSINHRQQEMAKLAPAAWRFQ